MEHWALTFKSEVVNFSFSPYEDIIVSASIDGKLTCHNYGSQKPIKLFRKRISQDSLRDVIFVDKQIVIVADSTGELCMIDLQTEMVIKRIAAHDIGISCMAKAEDFTFVTGDDDGEIKLWDYRTKGLIKHYQSTTDYITDFRYVKHKKTLLASSGEGSLSVFDVRKDEMYAQSEQYDDAMLSLSIVKNCEKVLCGSQLGAIDVYKWGYWGEICDRFLGHPESVDVLCEIDDNIVLSGSGDGLVRVLEISPNKMLGVLGTHEYPIECIEISYDKKFAASLSHDRSIKFWSIEDFYETDSVKNVKKQFTPREDSFFSEID